MTQKNNATNTMCSIPPLPRVIRAKNAPHYLGMSRDVFNQDVKPHVTVTPIGKQGIGYDRLELDAWFEQHKRRSGRLAMQFIGGHLCHKQNPCQDSYLEETLGILKNATSISQADDFTKALAIVKKTSNSRKRT